MECFLALILFVAPLPPTLGPVINVGTVLSYDNGYFPRPGAKWVSLPIEVKVIGQYQDKLVTVEKSDTPPYDEFYIVHPGKKKVGKLPYVLPSLEIRQEP